MATKSPDDMMSAVAASMKERTGRTLEEWMGLVQASGVDPLDQNAVRRWLKKEHGVLQNSQWAIADADARAAGWVPPLREEYPMRTTSGYRRWVLVTLFWHRWIVSSLSPRSPA